MLFAWGQTGKSLIIAKRKLKIFKSDYWEVMHIWANYDWVKNDVVKWKKKLIRKLKKTFNRK